MSKLLEAQAPAAALAIYPLDGEARLRLGLDQLAAGEADLEALRRLILDGLAFDAGDARVFSLLGVVEQRSGNDASAARLFDKALVLSKAEQYALVQMIDRRAKAGDYDAAVEHADVMMRRWGDRFGDISAAMIAMFKTPAGYRRIMSKMADAPPWRYGFFLKLAEDRNGAPLLRKAVLDLRASRAPPSPGEIALALNSLYGQRDISGAYRLFLFTLTEEERKAAGLVFDGRFALPSSGKMFDWRGGASKGVEITLPVEGGGALIQFEDRPVSDLAFGETIVLFPGHYRLVIAAKGLSLSLPGGLALSARCESSGAELARVDLPEGNYDRSDIAAEFDVPSTGCEAQTLTFGARRAAKSWNDRYAGSLTLRSVGVERPLQ